MPKLIANMTFLQSRSCFFAIMSLVKTCAIHLIVHENLKEKHFCEMHNKSKRILNHRLNFVSAFSLPKGK